MFAAADDDVAAIVNALQPKASWVPAFPQLEQRDKEIHTYINFSRLQIVCEMNLLFSSAEDIENWYEKRNWGRLTEQRLKIALDIDVFYE